MISTTKQIAKPQTDDYDSDDGIAAPTTRRQANEPAVREPEESVGGSDSGKKKTGENACLEALDAEDQRRPSQLKLPEREKGIGGKPPRSRGPERLPGEHQGSLAQKGRGGDERAESLDPAKDGRMSGKGLSPRDRDSLADDCTPESQGGNDNQRGTEGVTKNESRPLRLRGGAGQERQEERPSATQQRRDRIGKKTGLRVASLNVNGYGSLSADGDENKWNAIVRTLTSERIGVMLLQETHLTEERKKSIYELYKKKMRIFISEHPSSPTTKEGVAIVLNKAIVNTREAKMTEIIPGRAIQVAVPANRGEEINVLCIYAPTSDGVEERRNFYAKVAEYYETHRETSRPHLMAGDFNNTEDALDRIPMSNPDASIGELDDLKATLRMMMCDGWRATYPTGRAYTFQRNANASRLDRIYVTRDTFETAREWEIRIPDVRTDHRMVSVVITSAAAPKVGKGRA